MSETESIIRHLWKKHHPNPYVKPISPESLCNCLVEMFENDLKLTPNVESDIASRAKEPYFGIPKHILDYLEVEQ